MALTLARVDVHFGADHDRHPREHRGETAVEARRQEKRVDDLRPRLAEKPLNAGHVPGPAQARIEAEHSDRDARRANLPADGPKLVDAAHHRLESIGKAAREIEHHLFGPAHLEGVGEVHHANALNGHEPTWAR